MVLFVGQGQTYLKKAGSIENAQGLAHVDKVVTVIDVENRFAEGGGLEELFLPVDAELLTRCADASVYSFDKVAPNQLDVVVGLGRLHLELLDGV